MKHWGIQPEHPFDELLMVRYLKATSDELRSPERAKYGWAIHRQPRVGLSAAINYARKRWET